MHYNERDLPRLEDYQFGLVDTRFDADYVIKDNRHLETISNTSSLVFDATVL